MPVSVTCEDASNQANDVCVSFGCVLHLSLSPIKKEKKHFDMYRNVSLDANGFGHYIDCA